MARDKSPGLGKEIPLFRPQTNAELERKEWERVHARSAVIRYYYKGGLTREQAIDVVNTLGIDYPSEHKPGVKRKYFGQ